ncbi:F0F1 ATP synthase subunit epsilon [Aquipuribacter sp. MA13-6]|uniref:F0F1 ATP synthase subunit epsilon n=1 Tax=unclassified Aquipuribacter TaxID=2635084 RepID=UPI003EEE4D29
MALKVQLVAADREVWSGEARMVTAATPEGSLGVLPGHEPFLSLLADGPVSVQGTDGAQVVAEVSSGFLSVDHDLVTIVAQQVTVSSSSAKA